MHNKRATLTSPVLWALALLVALAGFLAACERQQPDVDARLASTPNVTNFTGLYADNDVQAGDDLIAGDDVTVTDDLSVSDAVTIAGAAALNGGITVDTSNFTVNGTTGAVSTANNATVGGTLGVTGATTLGGATTINDNAVITGTLAVTGASTLTGAVTVAGATALNGGITVDTNNFTVNGTTGAISTNAGLIVAGQTTASAITVVGNLTVGDDQENLRTPTIEKAAIITTTNGALWTVGASEVWFVHAIYCNVTTNFDCTGDDCTLQIGDGNDANGLLDLVDAELQTADTEGTGAPTGWQGFMSTDTIGAYLAQGLGFVYVGAETIDIDIRDTSAGTDPTAGAATCYLVYTRMQ